VLCLIIIPFHSLICVQLAKATLILKRKEYLFNEFEKEPSLIFRTRGSILNVCA